MCIRLHVVFHVNIRYGLSRTPKLQWDLIITKLRNTYKIDLMPTVVPCNQNHIKYNKPCHGIYCVFPSKHNISVKDI